MSYNTTAVYEHEDFDIRFDNDELDDLPYRVGLIDADINDYVWITDAAVDALAAHKAERYGEPRPATRASEVSFDEGVLRLAAVHGRTVTFRYAKGGGSMIETRTLTPESVFTNKRGDLLVGGQDPDRDEYRAYRVDRIKGSVSVA